MEKWIGEAVAKMHLYKIKQEEVARRVGVRREHINKILSGNIRPKNAEQRIVTAIDEIINERG